VRRIAEARILILGAGPCGLACARELERLGHRNWRLLESATGAGGLASSVLDAAGFTWDLGGHVVFSHFGEFDALLEEVLGPDMNRHDRSSYIRFGDRWIPYPFQNHLRHLPATVRDECLEGLATAPGASAGMDFAAWMAAVFGPGITRHFMAPYNAKVWATPAAQMSAGWIAERVAVVDYARALDNVRAGRDDPAWGPNDRFAFPVSGGTGEIYRRLADRLAQRIHYRRHVVGVDPVTRRVQTADGTTETYDALVSTLPLDRLVSALADCPDTVRAAAAQLHHNGVYMVGVGYQRPLTDQRSWLYFPDPSVPFYRVTNFAKYAAANVPGADTDRYCAFMTESAFTRDHGESRTGIEERVQAGLEATGLAPRGAPVASVHLEEIEYAYPVPTLNRDAALAVIQPWLNEHDVLSRGRFGAWRYEEGNMDHAVKMGIDAARRLVTGAEEELWRAPAGAGVSPPPRSRSGRGG
jgi:protoporphyrinogen oxidase